MVAASKVQAHDAAAAVEVDYEPLPAVVDPYEARQPGAPQLYDNVKNNISVREETRPRRRRRRARPAPRSR